MYKRQQWLRGEACEEIVGGRREGGMRLEEGSAFAGLGAALHGDHLGLAPGVGHGQESRGRGMIVKGDCEPPLSRGCFAKDLAADRSVQIRQALERVISFQIHSGQIACVLVQLPTDALFAGRTALIAGQSVPPAEETRRQVGPDSPVRRAKEKGVPVGVA